MLSQPRLLTPCGVTNVPDAWETLLAGSTIDDGDAWDHIQAQGGGVGDYHILIDGLEVTVEGMEIEIEIEQVEINSAVESAEVSAEIVNSLEAEI